MPRAHKSSLHSAKHPYLRQELWANGTLAFYLKPGYNYASYRDFHERMVLEAA
jgi:hypothetical protein